MAAQLPGRVGARGFRASAALRGPSLRPGPVLPAPALHTHTSSPLPGAPLGSAGAQVRTVLDCFPEKAAPGTAPSEPPAPARLPLGSQQLLLLLRLRGLQRSPSLGGGSLGNLPRGGRRPDAAGLPGPHLASGRRAPRHPPGAEELGEVLEHRFPSSSRHESDSGSLQQRQVSPGGEEPQGKRLTTAGLARALASRWRLQLAGEWTRAGLRIPSRLPLLRRGGGS